METMRLKAFAKINLGLDVLRRKEDGYHEVRMIMQTVGIYDKIELKREKEPGIRVKTNLFYLPDNENNLVYKAAKLLMDEFDIQEGVSIDLQKFIPVAAGMAGGSTDAASVLYGMNKMFGLGLTKKELMNRGVKIGADVPYCIMRGTALAEGIGEILTPLPPMPPCYILVAKPAISVSTKYVYENLHANDLRKEQHPDIDAVIHGLETKDIHQISDAMGNVLELVTAKEYAVIEEIKLFLKEHGALNAMMSGSGPTVFAIFEDKKTGERALNALRDKNLAKQLFLTTPFNNRRR